jgi:membrane protease YdiL (CAAX protease family)
VGLLVRLFLLSVLFSIPVVMAIPKTARMDRFVGTGSAQLLATGAVILYGYKRTRSERPQVFPLRWPRRPHVIGMLLQLGGALVVSVGLAALVQTVWPKSAALKESSARILEGGGSFGAAFLVLVLLGPLSEELLFRGLILHGFLRNYSRGRAIGMSALLFAVAHLDPWKFLPVLVGGLVLGWWRVESGSLWPGIIGHSVTNSVPVVLHELLRRRPAHQPATLPTPGVILGLCAGGILLLAGGSWPMRSRRAPELPATPPRPS